MNEDYKTRTLGQLDSGGVAVLVDNELRPVE